jgi:hypothetical protein
MAIGTTTSSPAEPPLAERPSLRSWTTRTSKGARNSTVLTPISGLFPLYPEVKRAPEDIKLEYVHASPELELTPPALLWSMDLLGTI